MKKLSTLFVTILLYLISGICSSQTPAPDSQEMREKKWIKEQIEQHHKQMDKLFNQFDNGSDDPFFGMDGIRQRFKKFFDSQNDPFSDPFFKGSQFGNSLRGPKITKKENEKFSVIQIDTTNLNKNHLEINIKDRMVTIKGELISSGKGRRAVSKFSRSYSIPRGVDEKDVSIEEKGNLIIIRIPVISPRKPLGTKQTTPAKKKTQPSQKFEI
ncbi:MAG: Hsp20 family protein [Bacteriovoracaceae bacterium]|jgi:HSP20 family molecular chaperone IbpA|nr:Hsp20 family protein [Bacteriovoracaceae bacterium]